MKNKRKGLSAWQITMMALGTVIGGSFFLGSSIAIHAAGPSVIISYILGGILVYFILRALSEMTVSDPSQDSFRSFSEKAFGHRTGFVVGWVYWTGMTLAMSSEAVAVSILMRKWFPGISTAVFGSITIISITLLNLLGARKLSNLESILAAFKLMAIIFFIITGVLLVTGVIGKVPVITFSKITHQPLFPSGIKGIAGSMLIVMFAYAGFEIIGLASSEADDPQNTIPKAIRYTTFSLVGLYIISTIVLILLIPTAAVSENVSPMVMALNSWGITWAGNAMNFVMVTAILSTMLAAMFGLGRMIRSLANENYAPAWLKDKKDVPYRGMLFSGFTMLLGLVISFLFPRAYVFLVSSGGFAVIFTYIMIVASEIKLRKNNLNIYIISWITLISLIVILFSMPFISGQTSGLIVGLMIIGIYLLIYTIMKPYKKISKTAVDYNRLNRIRHQLGLNTEFSKELSHGKKKLYKRRNKKHHDKN
ncbi:L-asparagine transporter-like permease [Clostridium algifaecis]|uniref:L-asparagine transporter-like permease n=1 Tax=Clostridium algifaecis TaxID=1472040 RepID=A0ABS4KPR3_9CLOT|nr:amino acid permease [Clostridium algifaecis]MBP2032026.1 L-asparagine transporter-like permease [Clostridium algifaecis]